MLRIAEELRHKLPAALGEHRLVNLWAYSYGNHLHGGIGGGGGLGLHADFAEVHVNFWLTPDEANMHPREGGGLEVFHRKPPPGSKFEHFNCKESAAHAMMVDRASSGTSVPSAVAANGPTGGSSEHEGCAAKLAAFVKQGSSTVRHLVLKETLLFSDFLFLSLASSLQSPLSCSKIQIPSLNSR